MTLSCFGASLGERLIEWMRLELEQAPARTLTTTDVTALGRLTFLRWCMIAGPLMVAAATLAMSGNLLQCRAYWLPDKITPQWDRLDPANGLSRLLSGKNLLDGLWGAVGVVAVFGTGLASLWLRRADLVRISAADAEQLGPMLVEAVLLTLYHVVVVAIGYAIVDFGIEWWRWELSIRQTPDEQREEQRQRDGDPHVRNQRRDLAQQWRG